MSLIFQSYLSFQTPMYTWKSASALAPAVTPVPTINTAAPTTATTEETTVKEDHAIHDLCLHFQRAMAITTIWNTINMDQEIHGLCHSFCLLLHDCTR